MANTTKVLQVSQIVTAGDMSAATVTSGVADIRIFDNVGMQINFTGTPTGTFAVQGSVDYLADAFNPAVVKNAGNWTALTLSPSPVASGAASTILLDLNQLSFPYIRVVYTKTSGTGTLNVYVSGKSV